MTEFPLIIEIKYEDLDYSAYVTEGGTDRQYAIIHGRTPQATFRFLAEWFRWKAGEGPRPAANDQRYA